MGQPLAASSGQTSCRALSLDGRRLARRVGRSGLVEGDDSAAAEAAIERLMIALSLITSLQGLLPNVPYYLSFVAPLTRDRSRLSSIIITAIYDNLRHGEKK